MKIKFNWGTGIFIVIIIFLASVAFRIYLSYQQEINLVSSDYYPKGTNYQEQIDKEKNTSKLEGKVGVSLKPNNTIEILFPKDFQGRAVEGDIWVYRPSDYKKDHHFPIVPDDSLKQYVEIPDLMKGKYIVKLDWKSGEEGFYVEREIFIK